MTVVMSGVILLLLLLLLLLNSIVKFDKNREKKISNLLGSRGFPLIGKTLSLFKPHRPNTMGHFMEDQISRYGKISSSNILGREAIISADGELNRFVMKNDMRLFVPTWLPAFGEIAGRDSVAFAVGETYKKLRSHIVNFFNTNRLQTLFLKDADHFASTMMRSWLDGSIISAKNEAFKYSFQIICKNTLSIAPDDPRMEKLRRCFESFMSALTSMPIYFPRTKYWKALQGRKEILEMIKKTMEERKNNTCYNTDVDQEYDYLSMLMKRTSEYTSDEIANSVLGMLFAGHDTTARAITSMLYFLADCPQAIQKLQDEHLQIEKARLHAGSSLSWDDYNNMEFTHCVIKETLRVSNIAPFILKKTAQDVKYKDIIFPQDSIVLLSMAAVHLDSSFYDDPSQFNPWRWSDPSCVAKRTKSFMPFGGGVKMCPGANLAKLEMAIFLRHLVLNFHWRLAEPLDRPTSVPHLEFPKGLPIKIHAITPLNII